ncbi:MAG: nitroreductase family deazaflavin-dependent oxidoreductase [Chloroflexota bacterium]
MAKTNRLPFFLPVGNAFTTVLLRVGFKLGPMSLLTVNGRKSGRPRTVPVAIIEREGTQYVVSPYGIVNWVRNLRAAGGGTLTRGRHSRAFRAIELSPRDAAPVLRDALVGGPSFLQPYYGVTPSSPIEDFEREVPHHPVFQIIETSVSDPGKATEVPAKRQ